MTKLGGMAAETFKHTLIQAGGHRFTDVIEATGINVPVKAINTTTGMILNSVKRQICTIIIFFISSKKT
jgi:hypothetical protein